MFHRYSVPVNRPASAQPVNSLTAMRLLAATPDYSSSNIRQRLTHALFSSLWEEDRGEIFLLCQREEGERQEFITYITCTKQGCGVLAN